MHSSFSFVKVAMSLPLHAMCRLRPQLGRHGGWRLYEKIYGKMSMACPEDLCLSTCWSPFVKLREIASLAALQLKTGRFGKHASRVTCKMGACALHAKIADATAPSPMYINNIINIKKRHLAAWRPRNLHWVPTNSTLSTPIRTCKYTKYASHQRTKLIWP